MLALAIFIKVKKTYKSLESVAVIVTLMAHSVLDFLSNRTKIWANNF